MSLAVYRAAVRAVGTILRRRPPLRAGDPQVTILVMDAFGMSGVTRSVLNIAAYLGSHQEVTLVSVLRRRRAPFFPPPPQVRVVVLDDACRPPRSPLRAALRRLDSRFLHPGDNRARQSSLWTDCRLLRQLRRLRPGVLIATTPSLNVLAAQLARDDLAVVGWEHVHLGARAGSVRPDILTNYGGLDALVVLTDADRRRYDIELAGATRVVRIPNAVPSLPGPPSDLSRPVVLAAGRLTRQKGFDMLLRAFKQVADEAPDWTLRICGSGRQRARLSRMVAELGLADRVSLPGRVSDMATQMEQASIFVLSSRWEGFPMVLLEAMSKGLPVVSFDCPTGPADIVQDGRTGFLVRAGDVKALAERIEDLIGDDRARQRFGAAAVERAEDFALARIGRLWDQLLADVGHTTV